MTGFVKKITCIVKKMRKHILLSLLSLKRKFGKDSVNCAPTRPALAGGTFLGILSVLNKLDLRKFNWS